MTDTPSNKEGMSKWLWLWAPALIFVGPSILKAMSPSIYNLTQRESGIVENLTAAVLILAIVYGARSFRARARLPVRWLGVWIALVSLAAFGFLGEEISWGQHYFHWETPEGWGDVNIQDETNLHNLHKQFEKIPRLLFSVITFVVGIAIPITMRAKRISLSPASPYYWLWPTIVCMPTCIMALTIGLPEKITHELDIELWNVLVVEPGELKECFLAIFMFLYTLSFYRRLEERGRQGDEEARPAPG